MSDEYDNQEDISEFEEDNYEIPDNFTTEEIYSEDEEGESKEEKEELKEEVADDNESIKDIVKSELVQAKFNKEFTSEIVLNNLSGSFTALSTLLEDSKLASENMEKLFKSIEKLKDIVQAMKISADKMNDVNQIVNQLNDLAIAFSLSNSNIEELIKVIGSLTSKTKELESDVNDLKSEKFYGNSQSQSTKKSSSSGSNIFDISSLFIQLMILFLISFILLKK